MSDRDLEENLKNLVMQERKLTCQIIALIQEAERRRLYLKRGYASAFDWLVKAMRYSHSAAYRRVQAAKLANDIPDIAEKIQSGEVNLTTITQLQAAVKRQERATGQYITRSTKAALLEKIKNKTSDQTQKILTEIFPEAVPADTLRAISPTESRLSVVIDEETIEMLRQLRDEISHAQPNASWSEVIKYALNKVIVGTDRPTKKLALTSLKSLRRQVFKRAGFACEFKNPDTGKICRSRYQLEVDHILPRSLGGTDEMANLRCLCKQHNLLEAERRLGTKVMRRYWPPPPGPEPAIPKP